VIDRAHASEQRDVPSRPEAGAQATPMVVVAPGAVLALQRAVGNAAVGRILARDVGHVSPGPALAAPERERQLGQLDRAVQEVLHRYGRTRVARPAGGWRTYQADTELIDFDWTALLFVLHRANSAQSAADYMTVLRALIIPALRHAGTRSELGRTPGNLPNLDPLTAGMWVRHPPPSVTGDQRRRQAYEELTRGTENLLTEAATRARQANITDLSIPGRRDQDFAFIMGAAEPRGARNQFYRQAGTFYEGRVGRAHVEHAASLEEVLDWIRQRARRFRRRNEPVPPLGTLYIVSHANRSGFLSFRITRRGDAGFFGFELAQALSSAGRDRGQGRRPERLEPLGADEGVDSWTRIFIRGCDVGRDTEMLNAVRTAFGGSVLVHAPKEAQYYGPVEASGRGAVGEGLADTYWLEFPADDRVDDRELARRLAAKYSSIGEERFREWLRRSVQRGEVTVARADFTETWGPMTKSFGSAREVPQDRPSQEAAIQDVIQSDPNLRRMVRFEECSWRINRRGSDLVGIGRRRHFGLHVVRRDDQGHLSQFSLRDRSVYGIDVRSVPAEMTSVPWR
jgi:hypothetical protein